MKMNKIIKSDSFILLAFLALGYFLGSHFMFENKWDFTNYHYYNPWAFLNGRIGYDIAPASVNTYLNPLLDLPFYFMVKYFNNYPEFVSGLQGSYYGFVLFFVYKISELFFDTKSLKGCLELIASMIIAATGFAVFMQIATTSNEMQVAILVLAALYILISEIVSEPNEKWYPFIISGLLLGAATGLKFTAITYCLASGIAILICIHRYQKPLPKILFFILGGIIGFLMVNGFWMLTLWEHFQNPVFPFANAIFKSEYFDDFNFSDTRFLPKDIMQWIFYPFYWAFHFKRVVAESYFVDIRFALLFVIAFLYVIKSCRKWLPVDNKWLFLISFMLSGYLIWLMLFSIIRYFISVEVLAGIVIVKSFGVFFPSKKWAQILYYSMAIFLFYSMIATPKDSVSWGSRISDKKIIEVEDVEVKDNTLVLLYNMPLAALIPALAEKADIKVVGLKQGNVVVMKGADITERSKFREIRENIISNHKGDIIVFVRKWFNATYNMNTKEDEFLKTLNCRNLVNNLDDNILICLSPGL